jgi:hypothetical protein
MTFKIFLKIMGLALLECVVQISYELCNLIIQT